MNSQKEHHSYTQEYTGIATTLYSDVVFSNPYNDRYMNKPLDLSKTIKGRIIWDTGAVNTVLTPQIVASLGLIQSGTRYMNTASQSKISGCVRKFD